MPCWNTTPKISGWGNRSLSFEPSKSFSFVERRCAPCASTWRMPIRRWRATCRIILYSKNGRSKWNSFVNWSKRWKNKTKNYFSSISMTRRWHLCEPIASFARWSRISARRSTVTSIWNRALQHLSIDERNLLAMSLSDLFISSSHFVTASSFDEDRCADRVFSHSIMQHIFYSDVESLVRLAFVCVQCVFIHLFLHSCTFNKWSSTKSKSIDETSRN